MSDRYKQLFLDYSYATFLEDAAGVIIDANQAAANLLERGLDEIIGHPHSDFLAPANLKRIAAQRQLLKPQQRLQAEAQYLAKSGQPRSVILDMALLNLEDSGGPREACLVAARESSRHDLLERELRLQRQSAQVIYHSHLHATFFFSAHHEISLYPPKLKGEHSRPLDWLPPLLLGERFAAALAQAWAGQEVALPPAWYTPHARSHPKQAGGGQPEEKTPPPAAHWLKLGFYPMRGRDGQITDVCVHALDCTAARILQEEQRRLAQHLSATLLTGTLQHELNNYLGVILAQASSLRLTYQAGQLPPPHLGAIIDAAEKGAGLLRRAVKGNLFGGAFYEIELNSLAVDCAQLLPHMLKSRLSMQLELDEELPKVSGDANALKAMLLELLYYAELGMPPEGWLLVQTRRIHSSYEGLPPSAGIVIKEQAALSTPQSPEAAPAFKTPAPREKEESLELAQIRAILREHRGQLEISYSGSLRVFEVVLPGLPAPAETDVTPANTEAPVIVQAGAAAEARARKKGASTATVPAVRVRNKILVADDEDNFCSFISWVLKENGYDVLVANDGQEAFERFQSSPQNIDLVILDAYMPRMGGLEAYLRMQVLRPDLPVLFASGFVGGPSADTLIEGCPGPAGVLHKPFTSEDLLQAVKTALAV